MMPPVVVAGVGVRCSCTEVVTDVVLKNSRPFRVSVRRVRRLVAHGETHVYPVSLEHDAAGNRSRTAAVCASELTLAFAAVIE